MAEATSDPKGDFVIRSGRPRVRTTFQILSSLRGEGQVLADARGMACQWIEAKIARPLPAAIRDGETFSDELHGQRVETFALDGGREWTLRYTRPDEPLPDRPAEPGRTWTTDLWLREETDRVRIAVRDRCTSTNDERGQPPMFRPRLVRDLSNRFGMQDVRVFSQEPWIIDGVAALDKLHAFLLDADRRCSVVLLTEVDSRRVPIRTLPFLLDAHRLAKACQCAAHVVALPQQMTFGWSERVGRTWSAFQGAIRVYRPGLDLDRDELHRHPLIMPERVLAFARDGALMEDAYEKHLRDQIFAHAAASEPNWAGVRFVPEARVLHAETLRRSSSTASETAARYDHELEMLRRQANDAEALAQAYHDDAREAADQRDQSVAENRMLRARIDQLQRGLRSGRQAVGKVPRPASLDQIASWAEQELAGTVRLHPRAVRGLKNGEFRDVESLASALELLGREYRDLCMGVEGARGHFESRLGELGLRCSPSGDESSLGQQGDAYFVRWPYSDSPRCFLGMHLRNTGNTRDPARCLAIYFFWDPDTLQVVVGWLPSHLPNSRS